METLSSPGKGLREPFGECTVRGNHCLVEEWCEGTVHRWVVPGKGFREPFREFGV
jgi:hypothetical protein